MRTPTPPLDPITLEIIWNGLKSINDESWITIQKSAFSTNIKERHDHSTAIADAQGRLIAQAEMSLPIHLASLLELMRTDVALANKILWSLARTMVRRMRETDQSLAHARQMMNRWARGV